MSCFSKTLKSHVSRKDISIQALSKTSGVDRSFIHHILSGKRIPADRLVLENIMKALTLTPIQAKELRKLYYIERNGESVYKRNLIVKELLESLKALQDYSLPPVKTIYQHDFSSFSQANAFSGSKDINTVIKAVLEAEASVEGGYIKLILQPDYHFLIDLLTTLGNTNTELEIQHIFCIQRDISKSNENIYNLKCLQAIMPLLLSCRQYEAFTYYDDVDSHLKVTSIFPYVILTSDKVIGISYDYQYATLFMDASLHEIYSRIFHDILHSSSPLAERVKESMDFCARYSLLETVGEDGKVPSSYAYSLSPQPCFMFFLTRVHLNKYITNLPFKETLIGNILSKGENYYKRIMNGYEYVSYFTLEGLDSFWQTGRITEIPEEFHNPLGKEDCLILLKTLYNNIQSTSYQAYIIDTEAFQIPDYMVLSAMDESSVFFMYLQSPVRTSHFLFRDPSISISVYSFLEYLKDSDMVYSREDTLDLLKSKILDYEEELRK